MTQDSPSQSSSEQPQLTQTQWANSHYAILGLHPSASVLEIRRAYRRLSKRYHPDTTELPAEIATPKFRRLNDAYGTLSNPEQRSLYDLKIGYSRWHGIKTPPQASSAQTSFSNSAYLDPTDRPLSAGEIFALFLIGVTFLGCLILVLIIGILRGEAAFEMSTVSPPSRIVGTLKPSGDGASSCQDALPAISTASSCAFNVNRLVNYYDPSNC